MVTPPLNGLILPGITRLSAIQLSQEWNEYKVTERIVTMGEVVRLHKERRVSNFIFINIINMKVFFICYLISYKVFSLYQIFLRVNYYVSIIVMGTSYARKTNISSGID